MDKNWDPNISSYIRRKCFQNQPLHFFLSEIQHNGWKHDSEINSNSCYSREPEFESQCLNWASQPSITPVLGELTHPILAPDKTQ